VTKALLPGLRPVRLPLGFAVMRSKMRREPDRATVTKVRKICCTTAEFGAHRELYLKVDVVRLSEERMSLTTAKVARSARTPEC
jgi:hypothetical protein